MRAQSIQNLIESAAARGLLGLPLGVVRALAGAPLVRDGQTLDPEMQLLLRLERLSPPPDIASRLPSDARADLRRRSAVVAGPPIELARVEPTAVAGAAGELAARLYVPRERSGAEPSPLLVHFHGGGWVAGDLDTHEATCRALASAAGVRVLSVDYRLAPEHPFPAAVLDARAALADAIARAGDFGADPARIAVGGDSAGGNLATVAAWQAARDGGPAPAFQLLIYPATDFSTEDRPSYRMFGEGFFLTARDIHWYRGHYLGEREAALALDARASPLLADDLTGVAPAHVVTAGFDPLRDEGEAYAARLRAAGVAATLRRHPGLIHGFANALGTGRASRAAVFELADVLRRALAP
ncbi:MAG: alpha/beta hydrolase [Solirubrobacteraceae bacterium]|nr:alpha/beta hydrolase [Solirubrobacteraceae bacterium]